MGLDVPMDRKDNAQKAAEDFELIYKFSMLNERDKNIILKMMDSMTENN